MGAVDVVDERKVADVTVRGTFVGCSCGSGAPKVGEGKGETVGVADRGGGGGVGEAVRGVPGLDELGVREMRGGGAGGSLTAGGLCLCQVLKKSPAPLLSASEDVCCASFGSASGPSCMPSTWT